MRCMTIDSTIDDFEKRRVECVIDRNRQALGLLLIAKLLE